MRATVAIIGHLLRQRGRNHDNWYCMQRWYWRWFYVLKALICLLLDRQDKQDIPRGIYIIGDMALWDFRENYSWDYGCGADWEGLAVGHGVFRNWFYEVYPDGYP